MCAHSNGGRVSTGQRRQIQALWRPLDAADRILHPRIVLLAPRTHAQTRFALACNMSSKIIEPIQSRCAVLRYTKLSNTQLLERLLEICTFEEVNKVRASALRLDASPWRLRTALCYALLVGSAHGPLTETSMGHLLRACRPTTGLRPCSSRQRATCGRRCVEPHH
eukprot:SAG11_NODE_2203_length_3670_cov_62.164395_5_plen_166_part_00